LGRSLEIKELLVDKVVVGSCFKGGEILQPESNKLKIAVVKKKLFNMFPYYKIILNELEVISYS